MKRVLIKRAHGLNGPLKCSRCGRHFNKGEYAWRIETHSRRYLCDPCGNDVQIGA